MGKIKKVTLISTICWSSAFIFSLMGIYMLSIMDRYSPANRYTIIICAVMLFGWAFLLLWADRNHPYRKGVFLITMLVAAGILCAQVYSFYIGIFPPFVTLVTCILMLGIISSFAFSYRLAKVAECPKRYNIDQHLILKHFLTRNL